MEAIFFGPIRNRLGVDHFSRFKIFQNKRFLKIKHLTTIKTISFFNIKYEYKYTGCGSEQWRNHHGGLGGRKPQPISQVTWEIVLAF